MTIKKQSLQLLWDSEKDGHRYHRGKCRLQIKGSMIAVGRDEDPDAHHF
jgi:hypothetical protein